MKSKASWFNGRLFVNTLCRYGFLAVINGIVFFFALPLAMLVMLRNDPTNQLAPVIRSFYGGDFQFTRFFGALAMIMGFAGGLTLFAYLHQPRQVNFYHAQPASRALLLTHRLLTGILTLAIPYLINVMLSLIVVAVYGGLSLVPWLQLAACFGYILLGYVSLLAVAALAAQLTGTVFAQAEVTLYILLFPLLVSLAAQVLMGRYLESYAPGPLENLLMDLSPLTHYFEAGSPASYPDGGWITYCVVLALCMLAACYLLYRQRPLERAGQAVAYRCVGTFLRLSGAVLAGIFLGQFFALLTGHDDYILLAVGTVLGVALWNMLCQVQIFRSSRAAFRGLRSLSAALAACAVIVIIMITGCFGYDSHLPSADSLTRIAFSVDCPGMKQTSSPNLTQPENIELVTRLVSQGQQGKAEQRRQEQAELEAGFTGTAVEERRFLTIEVTYYPRLGLPFTRKYHSIPFSAVEDPLARLLQAPEYLSHHLILDSSLQPSDYSWSVEQSSCSETRPLAPATSQALLDAYRQDLNDRGIPLGEPVYTHIVLRSSDMAYTAYHLPVYGSYARSLALLEDAGAYHPLTDEGLAQYVSAIEVTRNGEALGTITDPGQIAQTLAASVCQNDYTLLETAGLDDGYQLRVISEDSPENPLRDLSYYEEKADDDEASLVCYLSPIHGQTPDFLAQLAPLQP